MTNPTKTFLSLENLGFPQIRGRRITRGTERGGEQILCVCVCEKERYSEIEEGGGRKVCNKSRSGQTRVKLATSSLSLSLNY